MKELVGVGYVPLVGLAQDGKFAYYHLTNTLYVTPAGSDLAQTGHETAQHVFASGSSIRQVWTTDVAGELFVLLLESSVYYLYRSTDYGLAMTLVQTFQADSYLLERCLCVGYPGGVRTYAYAEYSVSAGNPSLTISTSLDGVNWTTRWTQTGGTGGGTRQFRHFHCIVWDKWASCFWISSGDANTHSMILSWDGVEALPDNTDLADLAGLGFTVLTGRQAYRAVDIIVTRDWIFWGSDTTSTSTGVVEGDKGIWRADKALANPRRVDLGDARYDPVSGAANRSTMWTGVFIPDTDDPGHGHVLIGTYMNTEVAGLLFESIFACHTRAGDDWAEVGRVYTRNANVNVVRAMYYQDSMIAISFTRGAGKGVTGETALMQLGRRDFIKDVSSAATITDGARHEHYHIPPMHPLYFVSPDGSDSNDGKTPAEPFKTFAKALASSTAVLTYGSGVVFAEGDYDVPDSLTLNWFNYPVGSGYEGETTHPIWLLGAGRGLSSVSCVAEALSSSHLCQITNTLGQMMIDSMSIFALHENAGARLFYLTGANSRVHSRDAELGSDEAVASALRSTSTVANRTQHYRSRLANGRDAGGTVAVVLNAGQSGEIFEAHACILSGYQGLVLATNGPGCELYHCLVRDYVNQGVGTVSSNTTGRMWILGCLLVDSGTGTGTSYNSTNAVGLDRRLEANAYTVLPLQVSDQGINGQVLITPANEFVDGDPLLGLKEGSQLIEAARGFYQLIDYRRNRFKNPPSIGPYEFQSGVRPEAVGRPPVAA